MKKRKKWNRLKAMPGELNGCLCCPSIAGKFNLRNRIAVGFGFAAVICDGKVIWHEGGNTDWFDCWTGVKAENRARKSPNHDWQIVMDTPLKGRTYQRHGKNIWVLVKTNQGFA
jgi:hypothetical protein